MSSEIKYTVDPDKGPIPVRSEKHVSVNIKYSPDDPSKDKMTIPCGCEPGKTLNWGTFKHTIYTVGGEQVEINNLTGYRCNNCSLVLLHDDAMEVVSPAVETALRDIDNQALIAAANPSS